MATPNPTTTLPPRPDFLPPQPSFSPPQSLNEPATNPDPHTLRLTSYAGYRGERVSRELAAMAFQETIRRQNWSTYTCSRLSPTSTIAKLTRTAAPNVNPPATLSRPPHAQVPHQPRATASAITSLNHTPFHTLLPRPPHASAPPLTTLGATSRYRGEAYEGNRARDRQPPGS
jgi:hypothetical protein